jgi:hypothetical protein
MMNRSLPPLVPSAPSDLVGVFVGGCQVILAWTAGEAGGLGFHVERATGNAPCGPFVEIGVVGPQVTAFCDGSVKPRAAYSYRVYARNASGNSSPSNVLVVVATPQRETDP